ncbi:MAG: porin [Rhodospirillales bacterium]|nr:porin [Rhodospirillales bacterium]
MANTTKRALHGPATWILTAALAATAAPALAQTAPAATTTAPAPAATPAPAAPPPGFWINGIHLYAQGEAGIVLNPYQPSNGLNFGQLFTDHANQFQLNQILLTAVKPLDSSVAGYSTGFKFQFMYGSDARYTHFLGELDRATSDRYQMDIVEANASLHTPWLFKGGIDFKAGQYPTPLGYETIDPSTNPFYSHSYIFNFGLPLKHTGLLAVAHVSPLVDVYMGGDTGNQTSVGNGENNGAGAFLGGIGLNMMGGNLTVLALTHFGPENATRALSPLGFNANGYYRFYNDIVTTWKVNDKLTLTNEINWVRDDFGATGFAAGKPSASNGFGMAQYLSYTLSDTVTANARAEIWRDDNNFFVAAYPANLGPDLALGGYSTPVISASGPTTYGELTLGITWKPDMPAPFTGLMFRPEVRWDHAYTNTHPFNAGANNNVATIAADIVLDVF